MTGRIVSSVRGTTYYWVERNANPDAPCIVFTHGLTVNHHLFDRQVSYFSKSYTVITWDVPLHGRSHPYLNFSYENAAAELLAILRREQIEQVVLVGQSMGGYVCQECAARHPDMVLGFVGVGATPLGWEYYSERDRKWLRRTPAIAKRIPEQLLRVSMARSVSDTLYGYQNALGMMEQMSKREMINAMHAAYSDVFTRAEPVAFSCPVLLVVGQKDHTGKVMEYNREWAAKAGFPLHIIPHAAHDVNADQAGMFNQLIDEFVSRVLHK